MFVHFIKKLHYRFENSLSKGSLSVIIWLGVAIFFVLLISSVLIILFDVIGGSETMSFTQAFYEGFYQLLSPGVVDWEMATHFRWLMALLCLVGLMIVSILIGLVSSTIESRIEDLRRGRTRIMENNHIIIYGWTSKIFLVIQELILANENKRGTKITILADGDKVEMENEVREKIEDFKTTSVIIRSGATTDVDDVNILVPENAKSIIILPTDGDSSDMDVIKTLMALLNNPVKKQKPYNIVTEINDLSKIEVAKLIGKDEVSVIQTCDIISRIMVQTCRQPGLSTIYNEILAFEGNEIYFINDASIVGKTFGELMYGFEHATVIGIYRKDGSIALNVDPTVVANEGESLIVIMEDDTNTHRYTPKSDYGIKDAVMNKNGIKPEEKDKTLMIGWNYKAFTIIEELDKYVLPGSVLTVLSHDVDIIDQLDKIKPKCKNLVIDSHIGDTTNASFLESTGLTQYHHVILLSYDSMEPHHADSHTLVSLIQLRSLAQKLNAGFNIVSEMLDVRNKALAELAKPDDFIISDNITSLMLAQISENRALEKIFQELFSAEGCEIYLKPITDYIKTDEAVNFYTLMSSAQRMRQLAIGYKASGTNNFGICVNPVKSNSIKFSDQDMLIVISGV